MGYEDSQGNGREHSVKILLGGPSGNKRRMNLTNARLSIKSENSN